MKETKTESTNYVNYRARIEYEDSLLNNRANLFLVVNGLGAVAVELPKTNSSIFLIISVMLAINLLWFIGSIQTACIIRDLTGAYAENADDPVDKAVRKSMRRWPRWLRNTSIIGIYTPLFITIGWFVGLILSM